MLNNFQRSETSGREEATLTSRQVGKEPPSPLQSLASSGPEPGHRLEAEAELRRSSCPSAHSSVVNLLAHHFSSFKCCLPLSEESFQILLFNHHLGVTPHLTARDTHKHHFAPLSVPRLESKRLVILDA